MNRSYPMVLATLAVAVGMLTACGSSAPAPASGNALVCQHYLAQRAWVKHLTYPTLADALKFEGYVAADEAQASGKLRTDLAAMVAGQQQNRSVYAASTRVYDDCTH